MNPRILANSATLIAFMLIASVGAANPPATPAASVREVVYFGPAGPVRIRLLVSINSRSADAVWTEAIDGLFNFCDRNGDGVLDPTERAEFAPLPIRRQEDDPFPAVEASIVPLRLTFDPKVEKITRATFAEVVRNSGYGAFGLRIVTRRADSQRLSAALFQHLDRNGSGRLSVDDLKAARERLAPLDIDEDEYITAAELLGRGVGANSGRARAVVPGIRPAAQTADSSMDLLFLDGDGPQAVKQLLAARGNARATSLKPAEFGADAKTFAALDLDGNGALDATELAAWLRRPADLEIAIAFDSSSGRLTTTPLTPHPTEKNGAISAALPGGRFQFEPPSGTAAKGWEQVAGHLREEFKKLAKDKEFVERKQLQIGRRQAFLAFADRNGDGKVDAAEVEAALKTLAPFESWINILFVDLGNGMFELLDRDGDGRLSPRELVESVSSLKPFAGPDGCVGPKDLVRQFQVRLTVDPIAMSQVVADSRRTRVVDSAKVPVWFTKMDRNGDGDVSLREFVGPIELFRKLDRDGDGLISPAEARAADK